MPLLHYTCYILVGLGSNIFKRIFHNNFSHIFSDSINGRRKDRKCVLLTHIIEGRGRYALKGDNASIIRRGNKCRLQLYANY